MIRVLKMPEKPLFKKPETLLHTGTDSLKDVFLCLSCLMSYCTALWALERDR